MSKGVLFKGPNVECNPHSIFYSLDTCIILNIYSGKNISLPLAFQSLKIFQACDNYTRLIYLLCLLLEFTMTKCSCQLVSISNDNFQDL